MGVTTSRETFRGPMLLALSESAWFTITGFAFIVLGTIAIVAPAVTSLAVTALVGWLLVAGGVMHGVKAVRGEDVARAAWQVVAGSFYVIAGLYFLAHPLVALGLLTLILATVLLIESAMDFMTWIATLDDEGSGWPLAEAVLTGLLGLMVWTQWPSSSTWTLGWLLGLNLMIDGIAQLLLGAAARKGDGTI